MACGEYNRISGRYSGILSRLTKSKEPPSNTWTSSAGARNIKSLPASETRVWGLGLLGFRV